MGNDAEHQFEMENLREKLGQHEEAARMFCGITNDLNNLLAVMKGQAQLASAEPDGPEMAELIDVVIASTGKAQNIIQLGLSKIASVDKYETIAPIELAVDSGAPLSTRMLVVDDEASMRKVLSRLLEKNGYEVTTAATGAEAIELSRNVVFDIAFVDLRLGDMSGVDVFRDLRANSPTTHVIFVSGDPSLDKVKNAKEAQNVAAFVKKPFEVQEIYELVSYILTMRSALAV